ncbi:unnamed protein product [Euphydryas editha]|uniref:Uncharacterized protein n=1 Tax=Euphydryas editha TaxID=104508 RepID=A0AAU9VD14_EUPED|nr:unnamed protein product [Euphydryas editha]
MYTKKAINNFISKLNCEEPHYCRGKTKRYYLPAELSINKLWLKYKKIIMGFETAEEREKARDKLTREGKDLVVGVLKNKARQGKELTKRK